MAGISITGLSTVYPGGVRAVDELDLDVTDGELFALLGPSGCGKTTLLRTIAGLEPASSGEVRIGGRDVTRLQPGERGVAMVFQDYALFPHMTVAENIAYPLRVRGAAKSVQRETASRTASGLSLDGLLERRPGQLSGGQQQRVALARAVAASAEVLLLDEPLSNLDARLRLEARTFLKKLQRELALTTVFVTHDQAEALALADRIAVMDQGRIRQLGTPREVFQRPADTFVANFIGSTPMNLVPRDDDIIGVRPEYLGPADRGLFTGEVSIVENLGVTSLVTLDCGVGYIVPEEDEPPIGTPVTLDAPPNRVLRYDRETGLLRR
ncbi:ABC transporter [Lentzea guizhouensis]|uniref:ABC transporter n=1 Tax=Lentzea guizhouensis TaxID=1586287 RepID=A0A1B2HWA1_9PSEU|nr:ABC transporter ATP-binding protein [Lentzea guizhouensis]ANZ42004.1 ABC transporter [Lentzea guizhouensis]